MKIQVRWSKFRHMLITLGVTNPVYLGGASDRIGNSKRDIVGVS